MTFAGLGNYTLAAAMLACGGAILSAIYAGKLNSSRALRWAHWLTHAMTALLTISSAVLLWAIFRNDFSIEYIAGHSDRLLPWYYKISAFWAGHEGSLLLWGWLTAAMSSIAIITRRKEPTTTQAPTIGLLNGVCWFFIAIMLFAANPFKLSEMVLGDGLGMNPMLQNPAMIAHPVLLFIGYAGLTIPFAMFIGALIAGRTDREWLAPIRQWVIGSWAFLTAGIVLGAWWAYVELGWGGYWAWDPVENASLFPWFTATALMHSLISHQRRGRLKMFNAILLPVTFVLCLFGTFLTRTGIVASVHAFADTGVGTLFELMMLVILAVSLGVVIRRRDLLKSNPLHRLYSTDGLFMIGCGLLTLMMITTLVGTIWPVLTKPFTKAPQMLGPEFYNVVVVLMALVLAGVMAFAPALRFAGTKKMRYRLILPVVGLHATMIIVNLVLKSISPSGHGWDDPRRLWVSACSAVVAFIVIGIVQDFFLTIGKPGASLRRYGGQLAHLGMAMIIVGVAGSGLYKTEETLTFEQGQTKQFSQYKLTYDKFVETHHKNYISREAVLTLESPSGERAELRPQRRKYFKPPTRNTTTEVAVQTDLRRDVYLILSDWWEADGDNAAMEVKRVKIEAIILPLVIWIWIGGIAMTTGAAVCLLPSRRKARSGEDRSANDGDQAEEDALATHADEQQVQEVGS